MDAWCEILQIKLVDHSHDADRRNSEMDNPFEFPISKTSVVELSLAGKDLGVTPVHR